MANSNTEHSKKKRESTAKARNTALQAMGYERFSVQLTPEAAQALNALRLDKESKNAAIIRLILDKKNSKPY
jgi:Holliday junction resolvasome RuvABC DNA-binding subunit